MSDPKRWLDDPEQSAQLRVDLQRAADATPQYDASAGLAALQNAIHQGTPASAGAGQASLAKLYVASGVAATLAAGVIAIVVMRAPASERAAHVEPRTPPHAAPAAAPPAPEPALEPAPAARIEPVEEAHAPRSARPVRSASEREIAQLARIKAVIDDDPRLALKLAQQGHREFGRGLLQPEREGLAIVALYALERRAEADERAQAYLAAHPKGVLAERVHALRGGQ